MGIFDSCFIIILAPVAASLLCILIRTVVRLIKPELANSEFLWGRPRPRVIRRKRSKVLSTFVYLFIGWSIHQLIKKSKKTQLVTTAPNPSFNPDAASGAMLLPRSFWNSRLHSLRRFGSAG